MPDDGADAAESDGTVDGEVLDSDASGDSGEVIDAEVIDAEVIDEASDTEAGAAEVDGEFDADELLRQIEAEGDVAGAAGGVPGGAEAEIAGLKDQYARLLADFDNFKKRSAKQHGEEHDRAAGRIVEGLLPVLDACDAALQHDAESVAPIAGALLGALSKEGLERLEPEGQAFDPEHHEAVMHEPADAGVESDGPSVTAVLRSGYLWRGRVLRPAMVQVKD